MASGSAPEADLDGGEARDLAERDMVAAWWLVAEGAGVELHDDAGLRWFVSGADDRHLNAVLATRLDAADADERIEALLAALHARGVPFLWWVMPSARPGDLGSRLQARGLVAEDPWPGLTLEVDRLIEPAAVPGLEIRRVTDDAGYADYERTFAPIMSPSPAFTELLAIASRRIGFDADAPELHYVGYLDGEPVATASLITAGGAAGIYNVATVEVARGRGIGAAMTAAAVRAGAGRGLRVATLQASTMGRSVYERLGFRFTCDFVPYRFG